MDARRRAIDIAIIEDAWSTVVVPPGWQAKADAAGHLFLTRVTA